MDKDRNGLAELEAPSCNIQEETRETHPFKGSKGNEDPSALAKTLQSCEIELNERSHVSFQQEEERKEEKKKEEEEEEEDEEEEEEEENVDLE
ncbi:hypothetical protein HZH66_003133 [Vespula vulgaris]|uniref:Uncharacterized protein n=1 Tax=Vespula vulgaris TaxID=7454 RepID=A0A834KMQ2_VESVU|nr:hypothetical protein HZH66_003133 [Vespula vulgaris]